MSAVTRVNARLDEARSGKLEFLTRVTRRRVSDVIKLAIDAYYEQVREERPPAEKILTASGFIGSGEGPADLSQSYKEHLTEGLAGKHDPR